MLLKAYAKINLSLDLTGVLPDGYHAIHTIMQSVSLYDTVRVEPADGGISLGCSVQGIPCDERNTAYKAARIFSERAGIRTGVNIFIDKRIPSEAGLAGGSADAAAVLYALNVFYPGKLTREELFDAALSVGADVPFCLAGGTRLCLHKGEEMTVLPDFAAYVLLAKPDAGVSTGSAFKKFDTADGLRHPDNDAVLAAYRRGSGIEAAPYSLNIFEQLVDLPAGDTIRSALLSNGAYYASMSGSGSCFFGLFADEPGCTSAADKMKALTPFVFAGRTVNKGIEII